MKTCFPNMENLKRQVTQMLGISLRDPENIKVMVLYKGRSFCRLIQICFVNIGYFIKGYAMLPCSLLSITVLVCRARDWKRHQTSYLLSKSSLNWTNPQRLSVHYTFTSICTGCCTGEEKASLPQSWNSVSIQTTFKLRSSQVHIPTAVFVRLLFH